ncbi:hypothetical protein AARAC_010755 [Aspergillus arachidicola]|uniref:Uncharacterized protein n=2 Tax=Aspergillus arachidicola TaxID=656916 RepID=A0A2G7FFM5_9EURO|nr:hypothetical protein AARAC_010755 [Aspergillus arachidicola]
MSDSTEPEDNAVILKHDPSVKADPDDELNLHNVPSAQPDWDELEDHERILHNDLFVAQISSITDPRPPSPRARPSSASVASPSTPALPVSPAAALPPISSIMSREEFNKSQIADQPCLPWNWSNLGKNREPYAPTVVGKWWYRTSFELEQLTENRRRNFGHIFRIMETELGEQRLGDARRARCKTNNQECWIYSKEGAAQVSRPGDACTRCRVIAQMGGCSLSKRRKSHRNREMESDSLRAGMYAAYSKVFVSAISLSSAAVRACPGSGKDQ